MDETPKGRKRLSPEKIANRITWVRALVSGEYAQQTDGVLRNWDGYCCLGVAGHALEPNADFAQEHDEYSYLPVKWAMEKLGLTGGGDFSGGDQDQQVASYWNDAKGYDFLQIADRVALATEKLSRCCNVTNAPELRDTVPGDYAREWLIRMENK